MKRLNKIGYATMKPACLRWPEMTVCMCVCVVYVKGLLPRLELQTECAGAKGLSALPGIR